MRIFLFLILAGFTFAALQAQTPQYSQYYNNYEYYNPAYLGQYGSNSFSVISRQSIFTNAVGGNAIYSLVGAGYIHHLDTLNSALGFFLNYEDQLDKSYGASVAYSYFLDLTENTVVKFGGALGIQRKEINQVVTQSGGQTILVENQGKMFPLLHFGMLVEGGKFIAGVSAYNINRPSIEIPPVYTLYIDRHYFVMLAYKGGDPDQISVIPSVLVRQRENDKRVGMDINARVGFYNNFFIGAGFRSDNIFSYKQYDPFQMVDQLFVTNSLIGMIGVALADNYRLGISYDYPLKTQNQSYRGTVEGSLAIQL